jgi:hypothetical protein
LFGGKSDVFVTKLDPTGTRLVYSTFLGGSESEAPTAITVDEAGSIYVVGQTNSPNFPTRRALQSELGAIGSEDGFITKLNPRGDALEFSTFLGGSYIDAIGDIGFDGPGNIYVAGATFSSDFPTREAYQEAPAGGQVDSFLSKITPTGSTLVYSTYLGGSQDDTARSLAVASDGSVYVAGTSASQDFPTVAPLQDAMHGFTDVYVSKFSPSGRSLLFSTYLGGQRTDDPWCISLDATECPVIVGYSSSDDFPTTDNALQPRLADPGYAYGDVILTKLSPTGGAFVFSSYLGGSGYEIAYHCALDDAGNIFITGEVWSTDFPTTANAFQREHVPVAPDLGVPGDAFVAEVAADGSRLNYSSYLGGKGSDYGTGIDVDASGSAVVVGSTVSRDFPILRSLSARLRRGDNGAFVTRITPVEPRVQSAIYDRRKGQLKITTTHPLSIDVSVEVNGELVVPSAEVRVNTGRGVVRVRGSEQQLHVDLEGNNTAVLIVSGVRSATIEIEVR